MSEEKTVQKDLGFKFEEMYEFLNEIIDKWSNKITIYPVQDEHFQWLINMTTRATLLKAKLQIYEEERKKLEDDNTGISKDKDSESQGHRGWL